MPLVHILFLLMSLMYSRLRFRIRRLSEVLDTRDLYFLRFVNELLEYDPRRRLDPASAMLHPFLASLFPMELCVRSFLPPPPVIAQCEPAVNADDLIAMQSAEVQTDELAVNPVRSAPAMQSVQIQTDDPTEKHALKRKRVANDDDDIAGGNLKIPESPGIQSPKRLDDIFSDEGTVVSKSFNVR